MGSPHLERLLLSVSQVKSKPLFQTTGPWKMKQTSSAAMYLPCSHTDWVPARIHVERKRWGTSVVACACSLGLQGQMQESSRACCSFSLARVLSLKSVERPVSDSKVRSDWGRYPASVHVYLFAHTERSHNKRWQGWQARYPIDTVVTLWRLFWVAAVIFLNTLRISWNVFWSPHSFLQDSPLLS